MFFIILSARPPPPIRETHRFARVTRSRETTATRVFFGGAGDLRPSCLFLWRAIPPRSHAGCDVSETTQTHSRETPATRVFFGGARSPLGNTPGATSPSQLGPASPQESATKPSQQHPQSPKNASPKPRKTLRQATSPKCTENPPKNRIISAKDPSIKKHPRKSPRG